MSEYFYVFEHGSGCTWGRYIVPAASHKLYVNNEGRMCLSPVMPSCVEFTGVKNLYVTRSDDLNDQVTRLHSSREKK